MRNRWLYSLWLVCLLSGVLGAAEDVRWRVATWNLYNYRIQDRWVDGKYRKDYPKPESEKEAIHRILKEVRPDVLLVQEIGGEPFLRELQQDLQRQGLHYPHVYLAQAADSQRQLAVLSSRPWQKVRTHRDMSFPYQGERVPVLRGLLEVEYKTADGLSLVLFTLHLKSRRTEDAKDPQSEQRRRGEARVIRDRILARYPMESHPRWLLAGDFNDHPSSSAIRYFLRRGQESLASRLLAEDSRGEKWTHYYRSQESYSAVDHILVSPTLQPFVVAPPVIVDVQPATGLASDHRLVWVDLVFNNGKETP